MTGNRDRQQSGNQSRMKDHQQNRSQLPEKDRTDNYPNQEKDKDRQR